MLSFWKNCKIGAKLQAAFALVMLVFVAALAGVFVVNQHVVAEQTVQGTQSIPSRVNIFQMELAARSADDEGWFYITNHNPEASARYLANYRQHVADLLSELERATKFANDDVERAAIADYHKFLNGPQGYLQSNEDAFAAKSAGRYADAIKTYGDTSVAPLVDAGQRYWTDSNAQVDASKVRES